MTEAGEMGANISAAAQMEQGKTRGGVTARVRGTGAKESRLGSYAWRHMLSLAYGSSNDGAT